LKENTTYTAAHHLLPHCCTNFKTLIYAFVLPREDYALGPHVAEVEFLSHEDVIKETKGEN